MRDIVWILGILVIVACLWFLQSKEGFQTVEQTVSNFWNISKKVDSNDAPTTAALKRVSDPDPTDPNDKMPLQFSKYISMYALAKYNNDVSGARLALFNNYDNLQNELSSNLYDPNVRTSWNTEPKKQTCDQLDSIRKTLYQKALTISSQVQDISGTTSLASTIRDENYAYQQQYKNQCQGTPLSSACIQLANQEGPVFSLLAKYDNLNTNIFTAELDISNNLQTINDTFNLLQCDRFLKSGFIQETGQARVFYVNFSKMTRFPVDQCASICGMNLCSSVNRVSSSDMSLINKSTKLSSISFNCGMLYDGIFVKPDNTTTFFIKNGLKYPVINCSLCGLKLCNKAKAINADVMASFQTGASFTCSLLPPNTTQDSLDSAGDMIYNSNTNLGTIDTTTLLSKLQQLSPYYLSPDTLQYITSSIISATDTENSLITSSDILINITNIINNIKFLTNTV